LVKQHPGGHWAFPKGHVETNETEQETARREIKKKPGLDVEIIQLFAIPLSIK
jgi:ADP-ribose pyrophosphatase YjhB (NUDIX family)